MKRYNRICVVCSTNYTYCSGCHEYIKHPRWMTIYHNENCKDVFNITSDYLAGKLDKNAAKEMLDKCDLSYKDKLHHAIVKAIDDINGTNNTTRATETTKEKNTKTKTQQTKNEDKKDNE